MNAAISNDRNEVIFIGRNPAFNRGFGSPCPIAFIGSPLPGVDHWKGVSV